MGDQDQHNRREAKLSTFRTAGEKMAAEIEHLRRSPNGVRARLLDDFLRAHEGDFRDVALTCLRHPGASRANDLDHLTGFVRERAWKLVAKFEERPDWPPSAYLPKLISSAHNEVSTWYRSGPATSFGNATSQFSRSWLRERLADRYAAEHGRQPTHDELDRLQDEWVSEHRSNPRKQGMTARPSDRTPPPKSVPIPPEAFDDIQMVGADDDDGLLTGDEMGAAMRETIERCSAIKKRTGDVAKAWLTRVHDGQRFSARVVAAECGLSESSAQRELPIIREVAKQVLYERHGFRPPADGR